MEMETRITFLFVSFLFVKEQALHNKMLLLEIEKIK